MKKADPPISCPACHGTKGFRFAIRENAECRWGGEPWLTGERSFPRFAFCLDCDHRVLRRKVEAS